MNIPEKVVKYILTILFGGIGEGIIVAICFSPNSDVPPEIAIFGLIFVLLGAVGILIYIKKS